MAIYKKILDIGLSATSNIASILTRNTRLNYQQNATFNSRTLEKQLGLPPKPKRPLSPFIQYTQDQRSIILAQNPNISVTDAMKVMAKNWKSVDEAEKAKMKAIYSNKMENYTKEMMLYKLSLTDEQKNMFHSARSKLEISEEKNKMKSRLKELGRPKRPPTIFVLYMLSRLHSRPKNTKFPDWLSEIGKEYVNLPAELKLKFQNESEKLREQYKTELEDWESKMIKMGHIDVIRRRVLMELKGKDGVLQLDSTRSATN
ncbi:hypothetical protein PV325_010974 [Microctonus aethiopoides]|uniref:HMG box domain-containing protein n=1 Tax=Microctonus aethiopoides TaxID=144406 RepID=A0AA39F0I5_9HYME|nr:hypothetical protein PV325_010974 [Microctonus aethiopoides]KAK0159915.1 hypothetical protein PV328_007376 [Microctonus aethiopoides]